NERERQIKEQQAEALKVELLEKAATEARRAADEAHRAEAEALSRERITRIAAVVGVALFVIALIFAFVALDRQTQANGNAAAAVSSGLAVGAEKLIAIGVQPDSALALALEADKVRSSEQTQQAMVDAAANSWIKMRYSGHSGEVTAAAFSPNGQLA